MVVEIVVEGVIHGAARDAARGGSLSDHHGRKVSVRPLPRHMKPLFFCGSAGRLSPEGP